MYRPSHLRLHRNGSALAGTILVLRTGMQWKHVPECVLGGSGKASW